MGRRRKSASDASQFRAVVVHDLAQARAAATAAAALDVPVMLLSPPGAGAYMGVGYFAALVAGARAAAPAARLLGALDCADDAGWALAALDEGIGAVCFRGTKKAAGRIADIAGQKGAVLLARRPRALDLAETPESAPALRAWLAPAGREKRRARH